VRTKSQDSEHTVSEATVGETVAPDDHAVVESATPEVTMTGGGSGYRGSRDFYCCGFGFGGLLGSADFFHCWSCFQWSLSGGCGAII
jgi:hypothetical protein